MSDSKKQTELTKELRSARNALLAVGLIMFAMDLLFIQWLQRDLFLAEQRNLLTLFSGFVLAIFVGLAAMVRSWPRLSLSTGRIIFWGIQAFSIAQDLSNIRQGILLKVLFTLALVKGLQSASRARQLQRELGAVFE